MKFVGDRLLGLSLLIIALAYGWGSQQWPAPFGSHEAVGPETFPTLLAWVLGFSSLYLMFKPDPDQNWHWQQSGFELIIAVSILLAYAFIMELTGFVFATALAVSLLSWRMGASIRSAGISGVISSVSVFVIFNYLLKLPLPTSFLEVL